MQPVQVVPNKMYDCSQIEAEQGAETTRKQQTSVLDNNTEHLSLRATSLNQSSGIPGTIQNLVENMVSQALSTSGVLQKLALADEPHRNFEPCELAQLLVSSPRAWALASRLALASDPANKPSDWARIADEIKSILISSSSHELPNSNPFSDEISSVRPSFHIDAVISVLARGIDGARAAADCATAAERESARATILELQAVTDGMHAELERGMASAMEICAALERSLAERRGAEAGTYILQLVYFSYPYLHGCYSLFPKYSFPHIT